MNTMKKTQHEALYKAHKISLEEYCRSNAFIKNPGFSLGIKGLEENQKRALTAVYLFCREIDDMVDACKEPMIAEMKLNFWSQEIDRVFLGNPLHPLGHALWEVCQSHPLEKSLFKQFLNGMQMDLIHARYPNFAGLLKYCQSVASPVALMVMEILGYQDPNTKEAVEALAIALQLINIIRDVGADIRRGKIYIPQEEMMQYGVTEEALRQNRYSENFLQLMQHQAKRAKEYYQQSMQAFPRIDRYTQRSGLIMAEMYYVLLDEIERSQFQVLHQKIRLTPLRKLWIAFKTQRKIKKEYQSSFGSLKGQLRKVV